MWDSGPAAGGAEPRAKHHARAAARHHPAAAGSGGDHVAAILRLRTDPDDRLRQRRQPPAGPRGCAATRDRRPPVARRVAPAHRPAVAHGKPAARA